MDGKTLAFIDAWSRWALNDYVCSSVATRENLKALRTRLSLPELRGDETEQVSQLYFAMNDARLALASNPDACKWCDRLPAPGDSVCETCRATMTRMSRHLQPPWGCMCNVELEEGGMATCSIHAFPPQSPKPKMP